MAATIVLAAALLVWFRQDLRERTEGYAAARASAGPALRATTLGDSVRITWPAGARAAALSIKDGDAWHRIELNQQAVAAGQFLYRPTSTEVLVRLVATDGVTESVRLLGLTPHHEAVPAPAPPPAPVVEVAQEKPAAPPVEQTADRALAPAEEPAQKRVSPEKADRKTPVPLPQALRSIHGAVRVDVRVVIAGNGKVQSAELAKPAESPYFNRLSLAAAQGSRFRDSAGGGSLVLHYEYTREGVRITEAAP
jgi:hypothetical protein